VPRDPEFARLLRTTAAALVAGAALVFRCYRFVDPSVATFVRASYAPAAPYLKPLSYPPPVVQLGAVRPVGAGCVRDGGAGSTRPTSGPGTGLGRPPASPGRGLLVDGDGGRAAGRAGGVLKAGPQAVVDAARYFLRLVQGTPGRSPSGS
jgi:hypothetical protein